jgi:hypothetical protein
VRPIKRFDLIVKAANQLRNPSNIHRPPLIIISRPKPEIRWISPTSLTRMKGIQLLKLYSANIYRFLLLICLQGFVPQLIDHLLARLLGMDQAGVEYEFTDEERMTLTIDNNRLYRHQVLRINYTSYDNRRAQDTVNPLTRPDIMMLSGENEEGNHAHPYWYARVLGIYHVRVLHTGEFSKSSQLQTMQFLHVRWFGHHVKHRSGWKSRHLHRVSFIDGDSEPFGFVDPAHVI